MEDGIVLNFSEPQRLFIYPATGRREDVAFVLDMNRPCDRVKVFSLEDEKLFYLDDRSASVINVKESLSVSGKNLTFEIGSDSVKIDDGHISAETAIIKPKTYQLTSHEKFAILKIKSALEQQAIIYDTENSQITSLSGSKIEITGGEIVCEKFGREEKYIIADGTLAKIKSIENLSRNPKTLGITFLNKIKNKQFSEACQMLSERLSANEDKLAAYFGEIKDVLPLNENEFLIVKKSGHYVTKLDCREDRIVNIEIKE